MTTDQFFAKVRNTLGIEPHQSALADQDAILTRLAEWSSDREKAWEENDRLRKLIAAKEQTP